MIETLERHTNNMKQVDAFFLKDMEQEKHRMGSSSFSSFGSEDEEDEEVSVDSGDSISNIFYII